MCVLHAILKFRSAPSSSSLRIFSPCLSFPHFQLVLFRLQLQLTLAFFACMLAYCASYLDHSRNFSLPLACAPRALSARDERSPGLRAHHMSIPTGRSDQSIRNILSHENNIGWKQREQVANEMRETTQIGVSERRDGKNRNKKRNIRQNFDCRC